MRRVSVIIVIVALICFFAPRLVDKKERIDAIAESVEAMEESP
ncbi:hypothetical protein [Motilimonas cestriensis]|nr:hypothetical protein [Motilimonas cestriensis]